MPRKLVSLPKQEHTPRAAIYVRVSTEDQAREGYGLGVQRERCRAMALVSRNAWGAMDGEKGGAIPFGYARTEDGPVIIPEQAETVRYILRHKRSGKAIIASLAS